MKRIAAFTALSRSARILAAMAGGGLARQDEARPIAVGDKVPDFAVKDTAGRALKLSELQKRTRSGVVSLTFWCTFCGSCRTMEGRLDQLAKDHRDRAAVFGIDANAQDDARKVEQAVRQKRLTVPILMDAEGKVADLFGAKATTTTVIIDAAGILRYRGRFAGPSEAHAEDALKAVLAGQPVRVKETSQAG